MGFLTDWAAEEERELVFGTDISIAASDFRDDDKVNKKYFGLAPGRTVHLKYAYNVIYKSHQRNEDGSVEVVVEVDKTNAMKCKGKLTWVHNHHLESITCGCPIFYYNNLVDENGEYNQNCVEKHNCRLEIRFATDILLAKGTYYQFERIGYFYYDGKSFHKLCGLRESSGKRRI